MSPVSSATGMKSAGETSPRLGWFQRSKRFERVDVVRFKVDERLIVQFEFFADQRLAQVHFQLAARFHARVHLRLEEPVGAAAVGLGAVERHVGVAQQRIGIHGVERRDGNADADIGDDLVTLRSGTA